MDIDLIQLNLNQTGIDILKVIIGLVMYSVALDLKLQDFKNLFLNPRPIFLALLLFYFLIPLMTVGVIRFFDLRASFALGLIMLTACPTGNLANLMTMLGKGNVALTIGLTSITNLLSLLTTPFLVVFLAKLCPSTQGVMNSIHLDQGEILQGVFFILGLPTFLGMLTVYLRPELAKKIHGHMKKIATIFLLGFILVALAANGRYFLSYFKEIFALTLLHHFLSVFLGWATATIGQLKTAEKKSIIFFCCHKNSGLGLSLSLQYFSSFGGMSLVLAFASIGQILVGYTLTKFLNFNHPIIKKYLA